MRHAFRWAIGFGRGSHRVISRRAWSGRCSGRFSQSTTPIDVVFDSKRTPVLMRGHELERVEQAQEREA